MARQPIVMKFGGTSVADAQAIARATAIVRAATPPVVVVVSAMAGVTDRLFAALSAAQDGRVDAADRAFGDIAERHRRVIASMAVEDADALRTAIDEDLSRAHAILQAVAILREASPRSTDAVASAGEIMNSRIVAAALAAAGAPSRWVDARRVIVTDGSHGRAAPLLGETDRNVGRELLPYALAGTIPVMGGYVGATTEGVTTTLGRGGSDYTAAVVGSVVDAREIQIWTDVDGMLTADPRVVAEPRLVRDLSFDEASELAYFGAKVLHPSTIQPAMARNIAVRVLNSRRPEGSGTRITSAPPAGVAPLAATACKRRVTVVDVTSTRMLMAHGFLRRLFEVFESHATPVDVVTTSEVSVSMTVDDDSRIAAITRDLRAFADVEVERDMAIVCVVGDNLRRDPTLCARIISTLEGLPIRMVSQAASRRNLTLVVRDRDVPAAMSRLHEAFFVPEPVES